MEFHGMPMVFSTWSCHGRPPCHPPIQESPHGIPWDAHGVLHMVLPWKASMPSTHPGVHPSPPWNSMGCPWCSPHGLAMEGLHAIHPSRSPPLSPMEFHGMPMVFSTWPCHWKASMPSTHPGVPHGIPWDAHGVLHMALPWKASMPPTHPGVHPPMEFHGMPMVFSTWPCHGRPPCHPPIQESPHGIPWGD